MVLLLIVVAGPIEARLDCGDLMVKGLMEAIEAHEEPKKAGKRGVDEDHASSLRQPAPFPGLNAMLHTGHRGAKISHDEARITNGDPQIGRGEASEMTVQAVRGALAFVLGVAHYHHNTFIEVNLETRHLLEAG